MMGWRTDLLNTGARILAARYRPPQATFCDGDGNRYHARFQWPGVVIVTHADDGAEIVRSLPGAPGTPSDAGPLRPVPGGRIE